MSALCPEQEKFNDAETEYLEGFLDRYLAVNAVKKGDKKNWVKKNIYPNYIKYFNSEGPERPNLSLLLKVHDLCHQMLLLYYSFTDFKTQRKWRAGTAIERANRRLPNQLLVSQPLTLRRGLVPPMPRHSSQRVMRLSCVKPPSPSRKPKVDNLVIYHDIKKNAYANLSAAEKEKWEALADEHNKTIKLPPSADHINK